MNYQFDFQSIFAYAPMLLEGTWLTIKLSLSAMVIGLIVAIICAAFKTRGPAPVKWLINVYIELVRNTPFLVQLFFFYFGLPALGIQMTPNNAALVAMVVNVGAYATEIIRAGIESINKGQIEAGLALNLSHLQIFRYVIIKPALRAIYPALCSQFILLMLASAVVSAISADDLTSIAAHLQSQTFRSFEIYIIITGIYLLLAMGFSLLFRLVYRLAFNYPLSR